MSIDSDDDNYGDGHEPLSRRDLIKGIALMAALSSAAGGVVGGADAYAQSIPPGNDALCKVLIERLLNTKFDIDSVGNVIVYEDDEVWRGDQGAAYHHEWLFDPEIGFKTNPQAALQANNPLIADHAGVDPGNYTEKISEILSNADFLNVLGESNLIYKVLKEKIHVETHGAHDRGVEMFLEWLRDSPDLSPEILAKIENLAQTYFDRPMVQVSHWYY